MRKFIPRCPKCKSGNFEVREYAVISTIHTFRNGEWKRDESDTSETEPTGASDAFCLECKHRWRHAKCAFNEWALCNN